MMPSATHPSSDRLPRILLFYPKIDSNWERISAGDNLHRPSLGLQYVMAVLHRQGYVFQFVDQVIEKKSHDDVLAEIRNNRFEIVGIHCNVLTRYGVCQLIQRIKSETAAKVLVGGPGTIEPAPYVEAGADVVLIGEAENRLIELIQTLHQNRPLAGISGLCFRDQQGKTIFTPPASPIEDLNALPFPHRLPGLVPLYGESMNPLPKGTYISLITSRGCPFDCTFCSSHQIWGRRVRWRSVDNVLAEMAAARRFWPDAYFSFIDDTLGPNIGWVRELCEKLLAEKWPNTWGCILHPSSFGAQRNEILPLMAKAGCRVISFGAQSASGDILQRIQRHPKEPEWLAEALAICKKNDILTIVTYIYGLPGETKETWRANLDFVLRHRPHLVDFHPLFIIPNTKIDQEYPDGKVTDLTEAEIEAACAKSFRIFYTRPGVIWNVFWLTLRKNPRYFRRAFVAFKLLLLQMLHAKDRRTGKNLERTNQPN
jgi:anaerobic magnesium-protoporphyrin IX monomethyl ester cyclase